MKKTFTGNTRLFLCISGAIIVIALIMQIAGAGLNLGIDFTGGSILNYSVGEDYDVSDVETLLKASGYTDSQITKAAPSAASVALQAELAAELEKAATEVAEAAAEDPEVAAAVDEAVEEAAEEAVAEEAVAEAVTPTLGLLNPDKSGIVHDGLTDLQIRLKLADATEGMEDVIKGAVVSVVPGASETSYRNATNQEISTLGYALSYAGSNIVEFDMFGSYDKGAVEEAVKKALEDGGYSVNDILFVQYDAEAEAARIAEEQAAAEQAQAEAEAAEETVEETAETEASAEETAEAEATEAPAEETAEAEATEAPAEETAEAEATEAPAEENAEAVAEPTESAGFQLRILIDMDDVTSQVRAQLEREMIAKYPNFRFVSIDHVSAIAGRDLLSNAIKALLIAFVCMLIYIAIRFSPLSGAAALFALLHDILIMCAFMVFFRGLFQVNSPFIAAILTIVGYSINNTIIIFDRIRETRAKPGYTQMDMMDVVEVSVSSTLSRTINTTLTTLFTLVCLYIFGVSSIKEFAFPLLVGMLAGTYSSVLLSGQVWAMWDKKLAANKAKKA
ncbi:MAG: protein translocase subunit SecF [Clostridia bacterium]|nr:protein translocase subunit SecF [Clostridia bacterium]